MPTEKELLSFRFDFEGLNACPFCAGKVMLPNGKVEWLTMDFWYVVCPSCGLKFMNPRPTRDSYRTFYRDYFWQQKIRNIGFVQKGQIWNFEKYKGDRDQKMKPSSGKENKMNKLADLRIAPISSTLERFGKLKKGMRVLEVGTSFPVVLNVLHKKHGIIPYAIEPSKEAQEEIKRHKHITFLGNYAEDLEKLSKSFSFDAIIFSHSLENTVAPADIMRWAKKSLRARGIIYVQCANLPIFDQMNPYHPYIFQESAFLHLAKKLGLSFERLSGLTDRMLTVVFSK